MGPYLLTDEASSGKARGQAWRRSEVGAEPGGAPLTSGFGAALLVPLLEALDAAGRVDELLPTGEERVAVRADLDPEVLPRRPRLDDVAAGADDLDFVVLGMDALLHRFPRLREKA